MPPFAIFFLHHLFISLDRGAFPLRWPGRSADAARPAWQPVTRHASHQLDPRAILFRNEHTLFAFYCKIAPLCSSIGNICKNDKARPGNRCALSGRLERGAACLAIKFLICKVIYLRVQQLFAYIYFLIDAATRLQAR
ncbi:MAG: hypothetical protein V4754_21495 [Pseudomonadota bacterium]